MKIKAAEIYAHDLEAVRQFYGFTLGLPVLTANAEVVSFMVGESKLHFYKSNRPLSPYHLAFEVPINAMESILRWAENRLQLIETEPGVCLVNFEAWRAQALYFFDSQGNILEFISRHDNEIQLEGEFSSNAIVRISEVAFATPNVAQFVANVQKQLPIHHFTKQPLRENFAALGTDEGLLIISEDTRTWFPTSIAARPNWAKVHLEIENEPFVFESFGKE